MRKHTVLTALALAFSLIILTQFAATQVRANEITADLNIDPDSLLLTEESHGKWITAYIGLPEGYDVNNINVSSVRLHIMESNVSVSMYDVQGNKLMVKFDRAMVVSLIWLSISGHMAIPPPPYAKEPVPLEVTGTLYYGTTFRGSDQITVFFAPP